MFDYNRKYKVTGRYMDGKNIVGYHIVAIDDESIQSRETRDRIIYLIGHDNIINMRIQKDDSGNIIIRGKGTNLNNLPVYDIGKDKYRNNEASQQASSSKVNVSKKIEYANAMGQYRITRRIMDKTNCVGYEITDYTGKRYKQTREKVISLAAQRLISNATVQNYNDPNKGVQQIIRGVDCELSKLPILIVNNGNIIDPAQDTKGFSCRVAHMKGAGLLKNKANGSTTRFQAGDLIICKVDGTLAIITKDDFVKYYKMNKVDSSADSDNYTVDIGNYTIEIFGKKPINMNTGMLRKWAIANCSI